MSYPVVGIDLGTTNTVVAAVRDGQASALASDQGDTLIPSVVSFHPSGSVLVGPEAKKRRKIDAKNTIYSVKRLIGRSWDSEEVRVARQRFPFEMREGPSQSALVVARKETYTLPEISAFVLRKAKSLAEEALGTTVERAVITVPANFNDLQRAATKVAGRVAGLEVMRILNEPTAAALAYGYGKISSERIAVYDFGGGTLDITLLDLSDNVFEVLATAGNTFLGGDDIDHAICDRMADELLATHRVDARADSGTFELLRWAAEDIKKQLTVEPRATITIDEIAHQTGGKAIDFSFSMQRRELEQLILPIVARTFDVCREALGIARLNPGDFSQVLLVGGSTRIPLVHAEVERFFGLTPITTQNPDEVVALGAAIQANALSGAEKRRSLLPVPPSPAARARMPSHPAARLRQSSMAPSPETATSPETAAIDTSSYGRPRLPTERGLQPTSPGAAPARRVAPFVAPPAADQPSSGVPVTADRSGSRKRTTAIGLGAAPPALVADPTRAAAAGAPTPSAEARRAPPGATLRSVAEQAAAARRAAASPAEPPVEPPFALDFDDEPTQVLPSSPPAEWDSDTLHESEVEELPRELSDLADSDLDDSEEVTHARSQPGRAAEPPSSSSAGSPAAAAATSGRAQALVPPATAPVVSEPLPARGLTLPLPAAASRTLPLPAVTAPLPAAARMATLPLQTASPRTVTAPLPVAAPLHITAPLAATPTTAATWGSPQVPLPPDVFDLPTPGIPDEEPTLRLEPPSSRPVALGRATEAGTPSRRPEPPLLIDVTPLTLVVETVGGYCDTVITRNSPIPCENSRQFATVMDNQDSVRVRVSQGEAPVFSQNTLLGEVLLSGLRAAPRGQVKIEVAFALDPSGMLNVNATDVDTGRSVSTRIRLVGLAEAHEVESMRARHAALQLR